MFIRGLSYSNSTQSANTTASDELVGWVPQNAGRGTLDILWTCFLTILACTWTAIHPRIHISRRLARWHKAMQLIKMLLAPEMVCLESLQEFVQARKLVRRASVYAGNDFKLVHAFYIGMMGVRYRTTAGWNVLWPGHFAYLLREKLVSWQDCNLWGLDVKTIRDKNKADGLIKLATLWQVIWFTLNVITRAAEGIPIAPIEAMTLAYVLIAFLTYAFWWKKPKDISTASFVDLPAMNNLEEAAFQSLSMEETYDTSNNREKPSRNIAWYLIARDCEESQHTVLLDGQPQISAVNNGYTSFATNKSTFQATEIQEIGIMRAAPLPRPVHSANPGTPDSGVITEWDSTLYMSKWWPLINLLGAAFGAVHLVSWKSTFPTTLELWLWRGSALASITTSILCMQFRTISLRWEGLSTIVRIGSPLIYIISRILMMAQVFAALRAMPAKTYDTSVLWNYWFHFS